MFKLPPILPSTNSIINGNTSLSIKFDTNAYEQWRANIHRQLEDDLQRQVRELLEETEQQERLSKLQQQQQQQQDGRVGQCSSSSKQEKSLDKWNEIDRRNAHVLHPLDSKNSSTAPHHFSDYYHQFEKQSDKSFYFDSYHSYRPRRQSSQTSDEQNLMTPSIYLNKYIPKSLSVPPINNNNNDATLLFGNSIIKSNKADRLNTFEQRLTQGDGTDIYVDKNGVTITPNGPFWPENYRILHPTPKLLTRELLKEEFYLSPSVSNIINQQTYDNQPAMHKYTESLKHPFVIYDMDKTAKDQPIKANDNEHICPQLIFESRFECGNLRQVKRVGQFEYELVLRTDLYTKRHTQWYYFRVQNMIAHITYRFRIINLMKKSSLYNDGMQILLFSNVDAKKESRGWNRIGHHINYSEYRQRSYNPLLERDINYYELDFQFEFAHSGDTCYICHCYPYTYTDLIDDLEYLSTTRPCEIFRREVLCESQAGNSCFLITVTDESVPVNKKKFVLLSARIHPGETNSSFMMRGLLDFITSNDKIAQKLRSQIVFKIIPMLNPDGVIVGNYRCSLTGRDKNRNFRHPRKQTFPIIYHMKELILKLQKEQREILAFCDLHGHSRKLNVFAYGCDGCDGPKPDMRKFLDARVLPFIMSKTAPDMFAFDHCKFHIHRCKESTGRVVMWKEMLIKNSFTLEASFAGSGIVEKPCHFGIKDYEKFGQSICQSLRHYIDILSDSSQLDLIFMDITKSIVNKLDVIPLGLSPSDDSEPIQLNQTEISIHSVTNCLDILAQCHKTINEQNASSSSDSDSDPEGGELLDIISRTDAQTPKQKVKKRRSEKAIADRIERLNRKREEKEELRKHRQLRIPYPFASGIDINSQFNLAFAADQMDKTSRTLPERGTLFTSKYANRQGYGLPIFTTERAFERKFQKSLKSVFQDVNCDQPMTDERETDPEQDNCSTKARTSRVDQSMLYEQNSQVKRATSLVSLAENQIRKSSIDELTPNALLPSSLIQKTSSQKHLQRVHHHRQQYGTETQQLSNIYSSSHNNSLNKFDTQSPLKHDRSIVRTKMPSLNHNNNFKKSLSQKTAHYFVQQSVGSLESKYKQRSFDNTEENYNQLEPIEHINQRLKKQFNLSLTKK